MRCIRRISFLCFCALFFSLLVEAAVPESLLPAPREITLPFASKPGTDRGYADIPIKPGTLDESSRFVIDFECDVPDAIGNLSLYLKSGNGWHSYSLPTPVDLTPDNTRVRMEVALASLRGRTEDAPGPVREADTIRFSVWRGAAKDTTVKLHDIRPASFSILALTVDAGDGVTYGPQMIGRLNRIGMPTAGFPQTELTDEKLKDVKIVVLPLNSKLSPETVDILKRYVENGGKLIAFYQFPTDLMKTLGFEPGRYVKSPDGDAAFAEIRFDRGGVGDTFKDVPDLQQKSWNITSAKPGGAFGAHVAAWWFDAAGRKTEYPALLVSERGAFFSHVITDDDRENKEKFLIALFERYDPTIRYHAIRKAWKTLFHVGDPRPMVGEKRAALEKKLLQDLTQRGFKVDVAFFTQDPPVESLKNLDKLHAAILEIRDTMIRDYCRSIPAKSPEFRAWWEHAGLGAYPGDWDRTMKELADGGYNAVISNLLWGGAAHYASDVLPRSKKFEEYGDQIEQAVKAGKRYGVEVHAWQVCYRLTYSPPEFIEAMQKAGRTQVDANGEKTTWLCPSHPENIELETRTFCELARNYKGLDGIHYDYIRYPDGNHCFCDGCRERFSKDTGTEIKEWPKDVRYRGPHAEKYTQWRCDQITRLVERVHREVKAIRPDMKISAAVFNSYPGCRTGVGQDWPVWVEKGWLDFICPMDYTSRMAAFETMVERQKELVAGRIPLYPGIGATATGISMTPDQVAAQIDIVRKHGLPGFVIFNLDGRTIQRIPPYTKLGPTKK